MATKQYKQLGCLDVQPSGGCGFQVRAETEAELIQLVATDAKQCHKLDSIPTGNGLPSEGRDQDRARHGLGALIIHSGAGFPGLESGGREFLSRNSPV